MINFTTMAEVPFLKAGDTVAIVSPAKHIDKSCVDYAESLLTEHGFKVEVGDHCLGQQFYFSGTDEERRADFQKALDDPSVNAILCARGGYGSIHIVDLLNWESFVENPKWILGFSDITVFHSRLNLLGVPSIHSSVPLNFKENSAKAIDSLFCALIGEPYRISAPANTYNKSGSVNAEVIGGNLSILHNLLGTNDKVDFKDKILFIEDLCEHLYVLDRMLFAFKKANVFNEISGLIVGGMTEMRDTAPPFGKSIEEIIFDQVSSLNIPVAFGFPAGHISDNQAIIFGKTAAFSVNDSGASLDFSM